MGVLKHWDIFKSVKYEYQNKSKVGFFLSIWALLIIPFIIYKETNIYKNQFMESKLSVENVYSNKIPLFLDLTIFNMACEHVILIYNDYQIENIEKISININNKKPGCRLIANIDINIMDSKIVIIPSREAQIIDMVLNSQEKYFDMSHKINKLEFGRSLDDFLFNSNEKQISKIDPNPLNGIVMKEKTKNQHSLFLYDVEIIPVKHQDIVTMERFIYHSNKNSLATNNVSPFINFNLSISSYEIEFINSQMNLLDLLSNIIGMIGGSLAILKIIDKLLISII